MEKINIGSSTTQVVDSQQITALANHILHRCGDVDFTGTDVTVTMKEGETLPADAAGIIVKCASENNGTVNIEGATEFTDEEWEVIRQYDLSHWMVMVVKSYGIPLANLVKAYSIDNEIKKSFDGTGRWLVGDGTAYINTGVILGTSSSIITNIKPKEQNGTYMHILGGQSGVSSTDSLQMLRYSNGNMWVSVGGGESKTSQALTLDQAYQISLTHAEIKVDDASVYTTTTTPTDGVYPLWLYWNNRAGQGADNKFIGGFGTTYIKNDINGQNYFFIPMTKDSVNGMYDLIGQQFYANANTSGAFTIE